MRRWRYKGRTRTWRKGILRVTKRRTGLLGLPRLSWGFWTRWWKWNPRTGHSIDLPVIGSIHERKGRQQ